MQISQLVIKNDTNNILNIRFIIHEKFLLGGGGVMYVHFKFHRISLLTFINLT